MEPNAPGFGVGRLRPTRSLSASGLCQSPLEDIFQIMIVVDVETAHRRWFPRMLQLSPCVPVQHPFAAGRSRCRNRRYGAVAAGYRTSGPRFSVERRQGGLPPLYIETRDKGLADTFHLSVIEG